MKKILIVDDEVSFLLSLRDGLSKHRDKFQILTAENGREAVDVLRSMSIDLLVTDLKLPEMNGFELLAWTSRHQPQLPVIVMSAFGTPEIEERLAKMDTLQFLDKPLDIQMLEEGIFNGLNAGGKSFIRGITLATFLQLMKVEKKNCTLKIAAAAGTAYLYVYRGELVDAEFGSLSGLDAALEIVSWNDAEIEMDGICRRQDDAIQLSMEHLLIEAFKRKDEAAELEKMEVGDSVTAATPSLDLEPDTVDISPLVKVLNRLVPVQEFIILSQSRSVIARNAGACSLTTADPFELDQLLQPLSNDLSFGPYRYVTFNSARRHRYLLFRSQNYCVLAKLKAGTQSLQIVRELEQYIGG